MIADIVEIPIRLPPEEVISLSCPVWSNGSDIPSMVSRDMYINYMDIYRYKIIERVGNCILEKIVYSTDAFDLNTLRIPQSKTSVEIFCISTKIYEMDKHGNFTVSGYNHMEGIKRLLKRCCHTDNNWSVHQFMLSYIYKNMFNGFGNLNQAVIDYSTKNSNRLKYLVSSNELTTFDLLMNVKNKSYDLNLLSDAYSPLEMESFIDKSIGLPLANKSDMLSGFMGCKNHIDAHELIPYLENIYKGHRYSHEIYSDYIFNLDNNVIYDVPMDSRIDVIEISNRISQLPFTDISLSCSNGNITTNYAFSMYSRINNKLDVANLAISVNLFVQSLAGSNANWTLTKNFSEEIFLLIEINNHKIKYYFDITIAVLGSIGIVDKSLVI